MTSLGHDHPGTRRDPRVNAREKRGRKILKTADTAKGIARSRGAVRQTAYRAGGSAHHTCLTPTNSVCLRPDILRSVLPGGCGLLRFQAVDPVFLAQATYGWPGRARTHLAYRSAMALDR